MEMVESGKTRYFGYDHEHKNWREVPEPDFCHGDMHKIPLVVIVQFYHEGYGIRWEKVWCPQHQAYEAIARYTDAGVLTESGCELKGRQIVVRHNIYQSYANDRDFAKVDFCWSVSPSPNGSFIVGNYQVRVAFPFSRFTMETKEPQPPKLIDVKREFIEFNNAEEASYVPVSLRILMFPGYNPPPKREGTPQSTDWVREEFNRNREYLQSREACRTEWEWRINGYNFRDIRSERVYHTLRRHYPAGYVAPEELQQKIYFCVERNGRTLALMVIDGGVIQHINTICWTQGGILEAKLYIVIRKWQELCGLQLAERFSWNRNLSIAGRQFNISRLQPDTRYGKADLWRLAAEDEEVGQGFYLRMYRNLYMTDLLVWGPKPPVDADDLDYLQKLWPFAGKIFKAAAAGNPEACYVIHLIYSDGNFNFREPDFHWGEIWYKKAVANGWTEIAPDKEDIVL